MTVLPLMAVTRYQCEPDFAVGQVALQLPPETVPSTVSVAFAASVTLTDEAVDVPVRMLMPLQAGTMVVGVVAAVTVGTAIDSAARSAMTVANTIRARAVPGGTASLGRAVEHQARTFAPDATSGQSPKGPITTPDPTRPPRERGQDSVSYLSRMTPEPNTRVSTSRVRIGRVERREERKPGPEHDRVHVDPDLVHQTGAQE